VYSEPRLLIYEVQFAPLVNLGLYSSKIEFYRLSA